MNNPTGSYYPANGVYSREIKYISIANVVIKPYTSAVISVSTFDQNKDYVYNKILTMDTQTYLSWNNNDDFCINWVLAQLGLTPSPNGYTSDNEYIEV